MYDLKKSYDHMMTVIQHGLGVETSLKSNEIMKHFMKLRVQRCVGVWKQSVFNALFKACVQKIEVLYVRKDRF